MNAHILMKPHLKKFVLYQEGLPEDGIVSLYSTNTLPIVLNSLLVGKARMDRSKSPLGPSYSEKLWFRLNAKNISGGRRKFLNDDNTRLFNRVVRAQMDHHIRMRIFNGANIGVGPTQTIREFITELELDDDISFAALYKAFQRYRYRNENNPALATYLSSVGSTV